MVDWRILNKEWLRWRFRKYGKIFRSRVDKVNNHDLNRGKTDIALKYAYPNLAKSDVIFWINCETAGALKTPFFALLCSRLACLVGERNQPPTLISSPASAMARIQHLHLHTGGRNIGIVFQLNEKVVVAWSIGNEVGEQTTANGSVMARKLHDAGKEENGGTVITMDNFTTSMSQLTSY